jgi:predicted aspartyl protease
MAFCLAPAAANATCMDLARVPLARAASGLLLAPVAIDGRPARLLLDTGAERTVLSDAAVQALGLPLDEWVSTAMQGVGGIERRRNADVASLAIGGVKLRRRALAGVVSLPRAPSLGRVFPDAVASGLLGMDLLSVFDLEIDPAGPTLALREGCADAPGWPAPWSTVAAAVPRVGVMVAPVAVNGARLRALLDTGSTATIVDARAAQRLGLPTGGAAGGAQGLGAGTLATRAVTLRELRLGDAVWTGQPAEVALLPGAGYDMILGMDVLGTRRLLLSFATSRLLVSGR